MPDPTDVHVTLAEIARIAGVGRAAGNVGLMTLGGLIAIGTTSEALKLYKRRAHTQVRSEQVIDGSDRHDVPSCGRRAS